MCYLNRFLQLCGCEIQLWKGTESSLLQTGARPAWLPGANKCTIVSRALLQSSLQPTFLFFLCFCLLILSFTFFLPILGFPLLRVILSAHIPRSSCNCICMNMIFFHFLKNSGKNCIFKKVTPFKLQNFQNRLWQNLIAGNYYWSLRNIYNANFHLNLKILS